MHTSKHTIHTVATFLLLFGLGCQHNPYLEDDEGGTRQDSSARADSLSLPYALSSKVRIYVRTDVTDGLASWKLQSDNPAVLSVDKVAVTTGTSPSLYADCTAVGEGETAVRLLDAGGAEQRRASVSVATPDRVRVLAHAPLRLVEQNAEALVKTEVQEARILNGSQGVFALIYQKGEQRLYGHGIVKSDAVAGVTVTNQTTSGAPVNEWLSIKPQNTGSYSLTLRFTATATKTLPVVSVPETELASFGLLPQQIATPKADQNLWVAIQSRDMLGRDVQGVMGTWTLNGAAQSKDGGNTQDPTGDLYRYAYADGASKELAVTHGAKRAALTVSTNKGGVYDTTYLGCSFGGTPRSASPLAPLIIVTAMGVTLAITRQRRLRLPRA